MPEVKHDGCADCGTMEVVTLYSILKPLVNKANGKSVSPNKAVCPKCAAAYGINVND